MVKKTSLANEKNLDGPFIAVVIPCYRVGDRILETLAEIGPECELIIVVDDCCPLNTSEIVRKKCSDPRISLINHQSNTGVGGATLSGYVLALEKGADIVVKLDGDGQMDPKLIPALVKPIFLGNAEYVKGNRFSQKEHSRAMPRIRYYGNLFLSYVSKVSTGYWNIFDPNNGFTAIQSEVLRNLPLQQIEKRFFFESDMLNRLYLINARVSELNMSAKYIENGGSNLKIGKILPEFTFKHIRNTFRRMKWVYFNSLGREFKMYEALGCIEFLLSIVLITSPIFHLVINVSQQQSWLKTSFVSDTRAVTLKVIIGISFLLLFLLRDFRRAGRVERGEIRA